MVRGFLLVGYFAYPTVVVRCLMSRILLALQVTIASSYGVDKPDSVDHVGVALDVRSSLFEAAISIHLYIDAARR